MMTANGFSLRGLVCLLAGLAGGCQAPAQDLPADLAMAPDLALPDLLHRGLSLDAVSPQIGPSTGGIVVTLSGASFDPDGMSVTFDGIAATQVQVLSATQLTAVLPPRASRPGPFGRVPVMVMTAAGHATPPADLFSYYPTALAFSSHVDYQVGASPQLVVSADVDRNGTLDLITVNTGSNNVSVLLGNGDGTFQATRYFAVGPGPSSVAIGDVDRDGTLDLVTANSNSGFRLNNASVLLGNGDGTFKAAPSIVTGSAPGSVALRDVNGDDKLDLVTSGGSMAQGMVNLGNGDGTFQAPTTFPEDEVAGFTVLQDISGDGNLDLITANTTNADGHGVSVLLGDGKGSFQKALNFATDTYPRAVAIGDFNGDGKLDLVTANTFGNDVSVLFGNRDGTFQAARNFPVGSSPYSVAIGDVDGDGKLDLITANSANIGGNSVSVLVGNGNGTFQSHKDFPAGKSPVSVAIGDWDGDHKLDLATANSAGLNVSVLVGNGDGTFPHATTYIVGGQPATVAIQDVNNDGHPDLVESDSVSPDVNLLLGNGDGTFQPALYVPTGVIPQSLAIQDVNKDGYPDLIVLSYTDQKLMLLLNMGDGTGTFQAPQTVAVGGIRAVAAKDVNGDGNADLVTIGLHEGGSGKVSVFLGNGKGTFQPAQVVGAGTGTAVAIQDVNGDGKPDLITSDSGNTVSVLLNNGDGSFQPALPVSTIAAPEAVTIQDVNGDGVPDLITLIAANGSSRNVSVLVGNGDGTFQPATTSLFVGIALSMAIQDVNGDGKPDLVTSSYVSFTNNYVSVFLGNGDGTFQPAMNALNFGVGVFPLSVAAQDVNGDGLPDLVTANNLSGNVSVLLNTSH